LHNRRNPLEEAVFIILTSQTNEDKYLETWSRFKAKYPSMREAQNASVDSIARTIKSGGLSRWKAQRIKTLLDKVQDKFGTSDIRILDSLPNEEMERELKVLDGIGIKSAKCIMMYSFGRDVFPIDTHCLRLLRRMGLQIPKESRRSQAFSEKIEHEIPEEIRRNLHIKLIQHGRAICKRAPECNVCVVSDFCKAFLKNGKSSKSSKYC